MIAAQILDQERTSFVVGETADPTPGATDVVVRVAAAGLAPGIFNLLRMGAIPIFPTVVGHEIAGTVVEVGSDADAALMGKRVRVHPLLSCGRCEYCTSDREMLCSANSMIGHAIFGPDAMSLHSRYHNGGLAELVVVPQANVDELPDQIGFELGAKVHDFANAVRALTLAVLPPASTLVVTAATGAMGTATILLAREFGVSRVIAVGRDEARLEAVRRLDPGRVTPLVLGADEPAEAVVAKVRTVDAAGAHAVIDYLPEGAGLVKLFGGIRSGGRIVHMGMNRVPFAIPQIAVAVNCVSFVGTRACTRHDALTALRILGQDPERYNRLVTHRFPLREANRARELLQSRSEQLWMLVVNPTE
ncbi:MAG: alcohol dehydrogenase catalytic domain-containing protein [Nakamurella sp.]